jgi:hypothetical protein
MLVIRNVARPVADVLAAESNSLWSITNLLVIRNVARPVADVLATESNSLWSSGIC